MTILGVILLAVFLFLIIKLTLNAIDSGTPSSIGDAGEREVSSILHSLPQEYLVINNVIIPDQSEQIKDPTKTYTTQLDHVVVSPYGIFVIETKNYSGWISGSEKAKKWKQTFKSSRGHYFYNPIKQNWGHTFALAERLNLDIRAFKPIVVFSDECELHVNTRTPVVYMSQLEEEIFNYTREIIPRNRVSIIFNKLCKINLTGEEIETKHIQSIGERFSEREMIIRQRRCPHCGGELRLRNGKYGAFYGCSNYPKCRFTHDIPSE